MSTLRRTTPGLLATLLLLTALSPIASVQAVPDEASEYYYGVEYDWSSLDSDVQNVTGLDIQELFTEIMADADDAGFNLDLGQLTTGASNVYVHQTEDISPQTIQNIEGDDVQVWSRTSDVVLRHGLLSNAVIMTDWSETTFGSDTTGFDIDIVAEAENVLTVDILYTEYLTSDYELVGADMDIDMMVGNDMNLAVDIMVEGGGEELTVDFDTGIEFSYSIASEAEWRLGNPSPIYVQAAQNDRTEWYCVEEGGMVGVDDGWNDAEVHDDCGMVDGTYIGSADYNVYLTGLPMEEFGFDAGEFDITISDELTNEGDYEGAAEMDAVEFNMRSDETLEVDLGDGTTLDATPCDTCPPGNPVMFVMMGNVLFHASESFGNAIAEDFEAELEDSIEEIVDSIWGIEDNDDGLESTNYWECDDGQLIYEWEVNDGYEHCMDGSDEMDFSLDPRIGEDWSTGEQVWYYSGHVNPSVLGYDTASSDDDEFYWCQDWSTSVPFQMVNDGTEDCDDGSDETTSSNAPSTFYCEEEGSVDFAMVNDGTEDCADGSDEGHAILHTMNLYVMDNQNNVLAASDGLMVCSDYSACDVHNDGNSDSYYTNSEITAPSTYGPLEVCFGGELFAEDGTSVATFDTDCKEIWVGGPEIRGYNTHLHDDGDNTLRVSAEAGSWDGEYDDVTIHWEVRHTTDGANDLLDEGTAAFVDTNEVYVEEYVDISGPGDYCLTVSLTQDGETEPYQTHEDCETVDEEIVSERLMTIGEALAESGLGSVLESFGENLEITFQELDEDYEVPVFPYSDGMWAPLWSNEHATIVGVGVYAWDEDGNGYVIAGPETTGYSQDLPMTFASIRYITGVPAQEAQEAMAEFDDLEDIVDVENHDLSELADDLEAAGADTSDLGLEDETTDGGETTDDGEDTPPTAEEVAEDAGLLPFVSPLTVMAMIGLAALAGNRRGSENE